MYYLGLDLGQKRDYSAVVVVERGVRGVLVRYAERMPLGTPYPQVVARVREIISSDGLPGNCPLAVDATGVGAPVVDMLRAARLGCDLSAVTITGGERAGGEWSVPKRDFITGVQVLLENGQLRIGKLKEAGRLAGELANMRMTMSGGGRGAGEDGVGWGGGA